MTVQSEQLEAVLKRHPDILDVIVESDGKHYKLVVVSDNFVDKTKVKRQLWVYTILQSYILSGEVHAIQMDTWTQAEWHKICETQHSQE